MFVCRSNVQMDTHIQDVCLEGSKFSVHQCGLNVEASLLVDSEYVLERCDELLGSPRRNIFSRSELDIPTNRCEEGNSVDKEYIS